VAVGLLSVVAATLLTALLWPLPAAAVAGSVDRRLGLKDRVTAAYCLSAQPKVSAMAQAAVADGLAHLRSARARAAYPLPPVRAWQRAGAALGLLLAAHFLPIPPLLLSQAHRQEQAEVRQQALQIKPVVKAFTAQADRSRDASAQQVARKLQRLQQEMLQGKLDKKRAVLGMDEVRKDLKRLSQRELPPPQSARQAAEKLRRQSARDLAKRAADLAQKAREAGQKELARKLEAVAKAPPPADPATLELLQQQLQAAAGKLDADPSLPVDLPLDLAKALSAKSAEAQAEQLEQLRRDLAEQMAQLSPEQQQALAQQLAQAAQALQVSGAEALAGQMAEAGKCLGKGDCKGAQVALGGQGKALEAALAAAARAGERGLAACRGRLAGEGTGCCLGIGPDGGSQRAVPPNAPGASLYAPRETAVNGAPQGVRSALQPGQPGTLIGSTMGAPDQTTKTRVPYYEVVGDYHRAAEAALAREEVLPAHRVTVRDYFQALESGKTRVPAR
jgi:hypothetical protein